MPRSLKRLYSVQRYRALGNIGTRDAAAYCIAAIKHPESARSAGEAYRAITGADLARDRLTMAEPAEESPTFEADNLDANLVPTAKNSGRCQIRTRCANIGTNGNRVSTMGCATCAEQPTSLEVLMQAWKLAPMLRRPDYSLELYVRSEGKYDVEPRTTRAVQRGMMTLGRTRLAEPAGA